MYAIRSYYDLKLDMNLRDNHLIWDPLQAGIGEGRLNARLSLNLKEEEPAIETSLKIEKLDRNNFV